MITTYRLTSSDKCSAQTVVSDRRPRGVSTYPTTPTTTIGGVSMTVTASTTSFLCISAKNHQTMTKDTNDQPISRPPRHAPRNQKRDGCSLEPGLSRSLTMCVIPALYPSMAVRWTGLEGSSLGKDFTLPLKKQRRRFCAIRKTPRAKIEGLGEGEGVIRCTCVGRPSSWGGNRANRDGDVRTFGDSWCPVEN